MPALNLRIAWLKCTCSVALSLCVLCHRPSITLPPKSTLGGSRLPGLSPVSSVISLRVIEPTLIVSSANDDSSIFCPSLLPRLQRRHLLTHTVEFEHVRLRKGHLFAASELRKLAERNSPGRLLSLFKFLYRSKLIPCL